MDRKLAVFAIIVGLVVSPLVPARAYADSLEQGDSGESVSMLQSILQGLGFYNYPTITGFFGDATKAAVTNFQEAYSDIILDPIGLDSGTGYVGSLTAAALRSNLKKPPSVSLVASPASTTDQSGTTLSWVASGATGCVASNGWTGSKPVSGLEKQLPKVTTTYTLSCTNQSSKTTVRSVTVTVASTAPDPVPVPPATYSITASAGPNGTISPTGTLTVFAGASPTYTINPATGYEIATVVVDGTTVTPATTYTFTEITSNHTIAVTFSAVAAPAPIPTPVPLPISQYVPGTPYLVPGSGFSGDTAQPSSVGTASDLGYTSKTIANWDVVPNDTVEIDRNVGLLAYHISGINKVLFSANGGPWIEVRSRILNPETNAEEFFVRLRASDFADGPIEIRAIAVPNAGIPRLLTPMKFYGNYHHTLPRPVAYISSVSGSDITGDGSAAKPFATIVRTARFFGNNADGATVYMMPGDYGFNRVSADPASNGASFSNTKTFLTLTAAPGVTRDRVRITSGLDSGIASGLVHVKNITLKPGAIIGVFTTQATNTLWIEGSYLQGNFDTNPEYGWHPWVTNYQTYATESEVHSADLGISALLERNVSYYDMWSQAITGVLTAVNVYVDYIDRRQLEAIHPDVDHFYGMEDVQDKIGIIRYKVTTGAHIQARGAAGPGNNVVYDKSNITSLYPLYALSMGGYGAVAQGDIKHIRNVLFIDTTITGGSIWDESPYAYVIDAKDVLFQNSSINGAPSLAPNPTQGPFTGVTVR